MAEINDAGRDAGKKGKPTKRSLRVDFTPMVDMNMLLITFFMFCTSLSIPQVMDVVMPTKQTDTTCGVDVPASKTITLLLGENNQIYYYEGKPEYDNPDLLKVTDYTMDGLRSVLLNKNAVLSSKVMELKRKKARKEISDREFKVQMSALKDSKDGTIVVIKPTDDSSYRNLVDALDEMQVCSIGKYAIVEAADGDKYLIDDYKTRKLTAKL